MELDGLTVVTRKQKLKELCAMSDLSKKFTIESISIHRGGERLNQNASLGYQIGIKQVFICP